MGCIIYNNIPDSTALVCFCTSRSLQGTPPCHTAKYFWGSPRGVCHVMCPSCQLAPAGSSSSPPSGGWGAAWGDWLHCASK